MGTEEKSAFEAFNLLGVQLATESQRNRFVTKLKCRHKTGKFSNLF